MNSEACSVTRVWLSPPEKEAPPLLVVKVEGCEVLGLTGRHGQLTTLVLRKGSEVPLGCSPFVVLSALCIPSFFLEHICDFRRRTCPLWSDNAQPNPRCPREYVLGERLYEVACHWKVVHISPFLRSI